MELIEDGGGRGYKAHVNSQGQLNVRSIDIIERLKASLDGKHFEATTDKTTLSNATETGIFYIQNTNVSENLVIDRLFIDIWESTGGSGGGILKYYRNVTVTGGTTVTPVNSNFGSNAAVNATVKKIVTSIDSGTVWWTAYISSPSSVEIQEERIIIPAGRSFLVSVQAPAGNTSMDININIAMYNLDSSLL